jgi:hypothetical protein
MGQMRNGEYEVILVVRDNLLFIGRKSQVLFDDLLHVGLVLLLY